MAIKLQPVYRVTAQQRSDHKRAVVRRMLGMDPAKSSSATQKQATLAGAPKKKKTS